MFICVLWLMILSHTSLAQTFTIKGGAIHIGNGELINDGVIKIKDGIIVYVGQNVSQESLQSDEKTIYANGKHIYPGLIAPVTTLGLSEIDALRQTRDHSETGGFNPNVRSLAAHNFDSEIIPTIRSNGILIAQTTPLSGYISGLSSILYTEGSTQEKTLIKEDEGLFINWPNRYSQTGWWASGQNNKKQDRYDEHVQKIKLFFTEAKSYCNAEHKVFNAKFSAICDVFDANRKLYLKANGPNQIVDAILHLEKIGIDNIILVGGREVQSIISFISNRKIPLILTSTHTLPRQDHYNIDISYELPSLLQNAGVLFCLSLSGSWKQRNLPFVAGQTVSYGLSKEEALKTITYNTAKILGIENNVGSLEIGKEATLIISKGDILDMKSSIIESAYIKGVKVSLKDKQKDLFQKYTSNPK